MLMEDILGLGSIYSGVERMSDVLAFLTAEPPTVITDVAQSGDMVTVFVSMAPNPVMSGHLLYLPDERVYGVDLSVEEGTEAIMTTGIAIDDKIRDESS